ncbi:GGDEF domain-containing protein [Xanthomonas sp. XNM01]|uniref:sensor domain-containing diguanylate cyclase n=1 Tax=Xanthomonas sp. XNM01 TaxID=2769289 RepID=UPI0017807264|nr:GGDEF domain-containing protein [Xanthomonas sp. XNM01]MBD9367566.1 GGDEF domain-containing protein [Xanthomonas sp. XNM01]
MRPDLESILLHCRTLPSPPGVALRIIELAQDPNVDLGVTADVIALDPALSARILRVANSPLYAGRRKVETLSQAMTLLGLNATLSLALGFSLAHGLRGVNGTAAEQDAIWRRSVLAALTARLLGRHAGVSGAEELMLAGLLQDIGALALLKALPDRYLVLRSRSTGNDALLALERAELGGDHAEVGAWLAGLWNLPDYLQDAIGNSETAPGRQAGSAFNACVAASGAIADLWLAVDDPDPARAAAQDAVRACVGESVELAEILAELSATLPEISSLFEVRINRPEHLESLIEQARELLIVRNLREIQAAGQARHEADQSEERMRHLTEQSRRDPLTGVYNRLQMEEVLERAFADAMAREVPLSIAFVDLDDFKHINDRHGHLVGDQVLRQFAQSLQGMLRASDLIARYGGEEFLIVLVDSDERAATRILERILERTSQMPMASVDGAPLHITFSAGIATHDARTPHRDARSLLQAADDALYGAKREGRNRVAVGQG